VASVPGTDGTGRFPIGKHGHGRSSRETATAAHDLTVRVAVPANQRCARSGKMVTYPLARRMDGEAAELPLPSQVVGLERAGVDAAQSQVGCPSYVRLSKAPRPEIWRIEPDRTAQGGMVIWSLLMP
jgi:hypothetical protein